MLLSAPAVELQTLLPALFYSARRVQNIATAAKKFFGDFTTLLLQRLSRIRWPDDKRGAVNREKPLVLLAPDIFAGEGVISPLDGAADK